MLISTLLITDNVLYFQVNAHFMVRRGLQIIVVMTFEENLQNVALWCY